MYVITGATGNTGSVAAHALLDAGKKVRVLVRNAVKAKALAARGAEIVVGDLWDTKALQQALVGAQGVYLVSPPDMTATNFVADRKAQLDTAIRTVAEAKVPHVVFLSSQGAQNTAGTGPILTVHNGEKALRAAGVPSTFVRAAYFAENWAAVMPVAKKDGVLPTFLAPDVAYPVVATQDIGAVVAQALIDGPRGVRIIELSGPREVSANDVGQAVSRALGREIKVVAAPLDAVVPTFTSFGISANVAGLFRDMYESMAKGHIGPEGKGAEQVRGKITIDQTVARLLG